MKDDDSRFEGLLAETAARFSYPPTPDLAAGVRRRLATPGRQPDPQMGRRWVYAAAVLVLLALLLAVPPVRASLVRAIRAGAITIFVGRPTETPPAGPLAANLASLAEPVSLEEAQDHFGRPLLLPAAFGPPDEVWWHESPWYRAAILLWRDPDRPGQAGYSLYQIDAAQYASKGATVLETTTVNGGQAVWIKGPHYFQVEGGVLASRRMVAGNALLWWAGPLTYRLEGAATLEEAVEIAESLR